MPAKKLKSARAIAGKTLNQTDPKRDYAGTVLDSLLAQTEQKQRATDLVFGTLRNRAAIDMLIEKLAARPVRRIADRLLNIIRIGAYELVYKPQTEEYAIVNEAAENAHSVTGKKGVGFVNAVLRQIERGIENRRVSLTESDNPKVLPQTVSCGCEFKSEVLPEPKSSPVEFLSIAFSLPKWLVAGWVDEFGAASARQICFASNRVPSVYVRPNTLKITANELAEEFCKAQIDFELIEESVIRLKAAKSVSRLPGFEDGLFSVQDLAASKAVKLLAPQPDWRILDLCAAPGGKAMQLAQDAGGKAKIFATDIDEQRLAKVRENVSRLQPGNVKVIAHKQLKETIEKFGSFDCVLLDVPCSNTGVLSKRPEVRYRLKSNTVSKLIKIQSKLFADAVTMLKPQGVICYSTCSIQADENSRQVESFLRNNEGFRLKSEELNLPSAQNPDHDGGYAAVLARTI